MLQSEFWGSSREMRESDRESDRERERAKGETQEKRDEEDYY